MSEAKLSRIALVDVNSFFASCERVLNPALANRPVVVLSNNDGCIVARSSDAKELGIAMGEPWFKVQAWAEQLGVVARSSNYELYGSLSRRAMNLIGRFSAWQEVYSIDESFIGLKAESIEQLTQTAIGLKTTLYRCLSLPVSVGIAPSKTLAKIANRAAKKYSEYQGVFNWDELSKSQQDSFLDSLPVTEVWGVARRLSKRLAALHIHTAKQLRDADPSRIRKLFSVTLQRTVLELRGIACIPFSTESRVKEQIMFSRSFSNPVSTEQQMKQVLGIYVQKVTSRLRGQGSVSGLFNVWAETNRFDRLEFHSPRAWVRLSIPTDEPITLNRLAQQALLPKLRPGARYVRAGITLMDLSAKQSHGFLELFVPEYEDRMVGEALDRVAEKFGSRSIGLGYAGFQKAPQWNMRREMLSNRGTTEWAELALVK